MLKLENITKYYYGATSVTQALRKINLEFKLGEFVAITGESGSGKTTLLNLISGLDSYEDGEMYFNDKKTSFFDEEDWEKYRKNEIAFIFQNYNLIDSYTVLENVSVTYIIEGYSYHDAKNKAREVLKLVGLENDAFKKASKLSGGQKQRLSIARALAKETNIIVADEPTGNLDSENGNQILELLKKLSKDKLVIVVTHNLNQIEPFITRKIRLHDGEVVLDEVVDKANKETTIKETNKENISGFKRIFNFARLNIKSQPKKVFLLLTIILINILASFIFYANFKVNLDEHKTKKLTNDIFTNLDDTRILVKKKNNDVITDNIMKEALIDKVTSYEKYHYINDINYYRPEDYKHKIYGGIGDSEGKIISSDSSFIELINHNKFMKSYTNITNDMLKSGRLPENGFEMVIYSTDSSMLGKEEVVLFKNDRIWGMDSWFTYNVKIVGLLKEPTSQAYFSDDLCRVLNMSKYLLELGIRYRNKNMGQFSEIRSIESLKISIDPSLRENEVSVPENMIALLKDDEKLILENNNLSFKNISEDFKCELTVKLNLSKANSVSKDAIGVSVDVFNQIYDTLAPSKQFAIFVEDYAYTDDVIDNLIDKEFESLSCFKSSVTGYDYDKVNIRYVNLLVSLLGLIGINLVTILLCYNILKVKKNDYVIFKLIGLNNKSASLINYIETFVYGLISFIIMVIVTIIVKYTTTEELLLEVFKYIKWFDYIFLFVILFATLLLLNILFGKFLTKKVKVTVLREE